MIDRSWGSPALQKFFTAAFAGTLIRDFWAPYESVETDDRMSIYRAIRMRGQYPTKIIAAARKTYLQTGQLPPLPDPIAANS